VGRHEEPPSLPTAAHHIAEQKFSSLCFSSRFVAKGNGSVAHQLRKARGCELSVKPHPKRFGVFLTAMIFNTSLSLRDNNFASFFVDRQRPESSIPERVCFS
jgi:hypothetical protein